VAGTRLDQRWEEGEQIRGHLAVGLQGLAPYRFEVEPTLHVSPNGNVSAGFVAAYSFLFTQWLILEAGGRTATEQTYFAFDYVFYLNLIVFSLSGVLLYVYRRGLGAPGRYRDPVCGMRVGADGPSATHDGETYRFCSATCRRTFKETPVQFARESPRITDVESGHGHH